MKQMLQSPHESQAKASLDKWQIGQLPPAPLAGWRLWVGLLGPGLVIAGTAIGTGEWLLGPAITAQYGGALLWLATVSIVLQVCCNLVVMRYAIYCGEPVLVGALRTRPGPLFWIACYALLDIATIWPYSVSNAAVPLVAAIRGQLPRPDDGMVKLVAYGLFILAFVPLIFGGTVYRVLEKVMTAKLVFVLGYLSIVTVFFVSAPVAWEALTGFFRFGTVPIRAETVVAGPHFTLTQQFDQDRYTIRGTQRQVLDFRVNGKRLAKPASPQMQARYDGMAARAVELAQPGRFHVEREEGGLKLSVAGSIGQDGLWQAQRYTVWNSTGPREYADLRAVPKEHRDILGDLVEHKGSQYIGLVGYVGEHGRLPPLDWATLAAFCGFAGAGGLTNALLSNYARDKGWGMGKHVGAIPSAVGGRTLTLSHVGKVFPMDEENLSRWRGWLRHILRDQIGVWMIASFLGMALPCMISLEFIRNATVEDNRVAAMAADGMASRFPDFGGVFWVLTLLCGFMILMPGQISIGDQIARRWTDIIWSYSPRVRRLGGGRVQHIYYAILAVFCVWGLITLAFFKPLQLLKISATLANLGLAFSAALSVYISRVLMPPQLRPPWYLQVGTLLCSLFFLTISAIVFFYTFF